MIKQAVIISLLNIWNRWVYWMAQFLRNAWQWIHAAVHVWNTRRAEIARNRIVSGVRMKQSVWIRTRIRLVFRMDSVANGRRQMPDAVLRKLAENGAVFICRALHADRILDVAGAMTDRALEKDCACLVVLVAPAARV